MVFESKLARQDLDSLITRLLCASFLFTHRTVIITLLESQLTRFLYLLQSLIGTAGMSPPLGVLFCRAYSSRDKTHSPVDGIVIPSSQCPSGNYNSTHQCLNIPLSRTLSAGLVMRSSVSSATHFFRLLKTYCIFTLSKVIGRL